MTADSGLDIGRRKKAKRIAEAIRKLGGGAYEARRLNGTDWLNADNVSRKQTGMKLTDRPPSDVTRALVIECLSTPPAPDHGEPRDQDVPNR